MPRRAATLVALPTIPRNQLRSHLRDFLDYHEANNASPRTRQSYAEAIGQFADFLTHTGRAMDIAEISRADIQAFLVALQGRTGPSGRPLSSSTVANRYRSLRAFFRWLASDEGDNAIDKSPTDGLKTPKVDERLPRVMTDDESRRLLRATDGRGFEERRDLAIISLLTETGLRLNELAEIRLGDLDRDNRTITVIGKGRRIRQVVYRSNMARALTRYLKSRDDHPDHESPWLWLGRRGRLARDGIIRVVQRRGRQAGIDGIHVHMLRHGWAHKTRLLGMQEDDLARLGGWRPGSPMLARYGASAAAARAQANFLSPLDHLIDGRRD
jgi:site-specific recombinase XerD